MYSLENRIERMYIIQLKFEYNKTYRMYVKYVIMNVCVCKLQYNYREWKNCRINE